MSKIVLEPNASGTGTFTITAPNSNSNASLSLPEGNGILAATDNSGNFTVSGNLSITGTGFLQLPSGTTAQRPASPAPGQFRYNTSLSSVETFTPGGWIVSARLGTEGNPAPNASAIIAAGASQGDGIYWYKPTGWTGDPFRVYTDMTNYGGGWLIVSKWYQDAPYTIDELYNGNERNIDLLLNGNQLTTKSSFARLSRAQMNALWNDSKFVARCAVTSTNGGTYFQKKITNTTNFDFWNAHYNSRAWSDNIIADASYIQNPGTTYKVFWQEAHGNIFNASTNDWTQPSIRGCGWWDFVSVTAPNVGSINVTRHMGFFGDITTGNQWILTNNPADSRFTGTDSNEGRATIIYLRT